MLRFNITGTTNFFLLQYVCGDQLMYSSF